jgi:DNA-binding NtrC family response regulator
MTTRPAPTRILLAEDDLEMQRLLRRILTDEGHEVTAVANGLAAMAQLRQSFDLVLTDLRMPEADGLQVLQYTRQHWPQTPVIVLTAFGSIPGAVDAMRLGAFDYLAKPLPDPQTLREVVTRALSMDRRWDSADLIAVDPAMQRVVETAQKVAPRDTTVLLLGESGVGKEVIARLLHQRSPRAMGPFIAVNCAALSEPLLESELFGHERGSFTGATMRHEGKFMQAHGGTLFLDEISETSPALQAKLLRVLQEKTFERVGGSSAIDVDVRIIAASNRDLAAEIRRGHFRQDLYYRLAVFPLAIPPLRQRPRDIWPLAEQFIHLLTRGPSKTRPQITTAAKEALLAYPWPGNVRELQNTIERSLILSSGAPITAEILGLPLSIDPTATNDRVGTLKEMEARAIRAALEAESGHRRRAAKRLGIALRTLQYKIKEYDLE